MELVILEIPVVGLQRYEYPEVVGEPTEEISPEHNILFTPASDVGTWFTITNTESILEHPEVVVTVRIYSVVSFGIEGFVRVTSGLASLLLDKPVLGVHKY